MMRLMAFIVLFATVADAQSYLQFRRGNTSALPTGQVGEPLFTRDSLDVYMGSDSGNVLIGGRSVVYGKATFAKDGGSTDAYAITLVPAPTKYWTGMRIAFRANTANTGTATLNVNSLGAKTIYKGGGAGDTLTTGDIAANDVVSVVFSDSAFYLQTAVQEYVDPALVFKQVPSDVFGLTTSSFTSTLNDTITVHAVILPRAIRLGEAWIATGTLTGSSTRTFSIAVYSAEKARLDTTGATAWPGDGTGGVATFGIGATVGPGLVYVAWSTNAGSGVTMTFRSPDLSSNSIFSGIVAGQNTTYPLVGYATTKLSAGAGWPATITITKSATTTLFPYIILAGTSVD